MSLEYLKVSGSEEVFVICFRDPVRAGWLCPLQRPGSSHLRQSTWPLHRGLPPSSGLCCSVCQDPLRRLGTSLEAHPRSPHLPLPACVQQHRPGAASRARFPCRTAILAAQCDYFKSFAGGTRLLTLATYDVLIACTVSL